MNKKDKNRQSLIVATLDCIHEIGLIQTSVSEIISRAGLSRGMIHLHFGGKDNLIVEAAKYANEQYYQSLDQNIMGLNNEPGLLIQTAVKSDLSHQVLNERDVAIWHEFRGGARTNNGIAQFSDTRDKRHRDLLGSAIFKICEKERINSPIEAAKDYTTGLIALTEGLWTDFLLHPDEFDRVSAQRVVFKFLAGIWPNSFNEQGAL